MKKLSPEQTQVISVMDKNDRILIRWPGGFWTYKGAKVVSRLPGWDDNEYDVPEWYCGVRTLSVMHKKGYVLLNGTIGTCTLISGKKM